MILTKKISTLLSLSIIVIISFILAVIIIDQSQRLTELEQPVPLYIFQEMLE